MNLKKPSFSWYLQVSFSYHRQSGSGVDKHLMRCSPFFDKRFRHSYHSVQTNTRFCCSAIWNWFLAELFVRTFNIKYFILSFYLRICLFIPLINIALHHTIWWKTTFSATFWKNAIEQQVDLCAVMASNCRLQELMRNTWEDPWNWYQCKGWERMCI